MVGVGVVEGRRDVLPEVGERGLDVVVGGDHHGGVVRRQLEEGAEAVDGQQLGHVRPVLGLLQRGDLRQLPVLGRQLGGGRDLDRLGVAQGALGEGGEPAQRLDLVAEQVDAHGAVLGRRVEIDETPANGELPAVLDLLDAFVAGRDEVGRELVEVDQVALGDPHATGAQLGVGHLLAQRDGADHDDRGLVAGRMDERVQRGDAQAHEVRRRRQVRLVGHAAARVEAHRAGAQPRPQVGRQVARAAVVAGHDQCRPRRVGLGFDERRGQVGAQRR